jgi:hypothetical protein
MSANKPILTTKKIIPAIFCCLFKTTRIKGKQLSLEISRIKFKNYHTLRIDQVSLSLPDSNASLLLEKIELSISAKDLLRIRLPRIISSTGSINTSPVCSPVPGYFCYDQKNDALKIIVEISDFRPDILLPSLLPFYCRHLASIRTSGTLSLQASITLDRQRPAKNNFDIQLQKKDFSIDDSVVQAFTYLNAPFVHSFLTKDGAIREIILDSKNPDFKELTRISELFQHTIVCTEDPNFFSHKGFDKKLAGYAIAANLKEKKFARGASTITMQLAKNLFLPMEKNLKRKGEELIITWLIEEKTNLSKKRILELYLNIIEFGDNIYGISEATRFYFAKEPADLDLLESLILSYIIPRPKYFWEAVLEKSQRLTTNLRKHVERFSRILLKKQHISQSQFDNIRFEVQFADRPEPLKF